MTCCSAVRSVTLNLANFSEVAKQVASWLKCFCLRSLASGRGSFVKTASVVPDGFEVAVDSKLSSRRVLHDRQRIN